jgi:glycosyltransferase involved in cell wall biosynthesis
VKPAWQWRLIYRLACQRFDAICFVSDFIRREAEAIYPAIRGLSRTVRNPYELPELPTPEERAAARSSLGLPPDAPVVGNAGWLIERKRWDVFLQVAKLVTAEIPDGVFLIAGDGPLRGRLEGLARELGVADRVRWLGWRENLSAFYRSLDVLLFPTDWDAAPRTPQEGIASGVPVVASAAHSGLDEVIAGPEFGFLTVEHDIQWLAEKVILLLRDRQLNHRITRAARARLAELGSPERCGDALEQMLNGNASVRQGCEKPGTRSWYKR